jgi:CHAD domain-containing protein
MGAHPTKIEVEIPAPTKLAKLARKRLERFATLFPKSLVSDARETIHDLRVASRRLQQVLRIVLPDFKSTTRRKLSRLLPKTRRAFGPCRNLDVSLGLVEKQLGAAATASLRRAWEAVGNWLEENRAAELTRAREQLQDYDLIGFIVRVRARLADMHLEPSIPEELSERVRSAFAVWKDSLASVQTDPDVKAVHAFRIAGKRLRYRTELLASSGEASVKRLVQDLKGLQDSLGDWHDRFVLRQHVAEFIGRPGFLAEEPGLCRTLLLEMEREKQRDQAAVGEIIAKAVAIAEREAQRDAGEPLAPQDAKDQ